MKCPYCGKEMEKGVIVSPEPINLARPPFGGRCSVDVWLCRDCRKIMIEF